MRQRPTLDGRFVRCPPSGDGHKLEDCGSPNVEGPDFEGLYDCLDCGIWFDVANAHAAIATIRDGG